MPEIDNPVLSPLNGSASLKDHELDAALQLLVERAQYITGATGAALALLQGEQMICRASVGVPGPAVGARLQVSSGLTGESVTRKQLLRCDNAETDPRVNLETCRQLGIASIVVMPLLTRSGQVHGLFELFSDHPYAFEERDLIALERMGDLTATALDLAEKQRDTVVPAVNSAVPPQPTTPRASQESLEKATTSAPSETAPAEPVPTLPLIPVSAPLGPAALHSSADEQPPNVEIAAAPIPEAMRRLRKCSTCGFPVSEGRELCVDCENKRYGPAESGESAPAEFVPAFLASSPPPEESWLANHVNLLAVLVLVLSIVVAVVVFR